MDYLSATVEILHWRRGRDNGNRSLAGAYPRVSAEDRALLLLRGVRRTILRCERREKRQEGRRLPQRYWIQNVLSAQESSGASSAQG